jgi:hypothetical protein
LIINRYSYTIAFCSTLKELQDLASQHELIAENLRERSVKQIQITIKECREQRKKYLDDYNKIKRQLDKQQDLLVKVCETKNCPIVKLGTNTLIHPPHVSPSPSNTPIDPPHSPLVNTWGGGGSISLFVPSLYF